MSEKFWCGDAPTICEVCLNPLKATFIDGKMRNSWWAKTCLRCARVHGVGLGTGKGQMYRKTVDGKWVKTDG